MRKYDVVIIGAGIGGLVCGGYLARAGVKCLILERLKRPGGYCSSFFKGRHIFDIGPHSFGSCRNRGQVGKLIRTFDLEGELAFRRKRITNIIRTPEWSVHFDIDVSVTKKTIKKTFPKEAGNVERFLDLMLESNIMHAHATLKGRSFREVLDTFFTDPGIKFLFGVLVGNLGLIPENTAAFTALILYREHIFDGGYYPEGGMQNFSDLLARKYEELGGDIAYMSEAKEILIESDRVKGVEAKNGKVYYCDNLIVNCDAVHTSRHLIRDERYSRRFSQALERFVPSPSFFAVHVSLDEEIDNEFVRTSTLWDFDDIDIESVFSKVQSGIIEEDPGYLVIGFPYLSDTETKADVLTLLVLAPYKGSSAWESKKDILARNLLKRASSILPELGRRKATLHINTPVDLYRYSNNFNGAISGWASMPDQIGDALFNFNSVLGNLFQAGHWASTSGGQGGIPMAVYSGRTIARSVLSKLDEGCVS